MALVKQSIVIADTAAHTLGLGVDMGKLARLDILSSSDTSQSLTITDADSRIIRYLPSGDYTTKYFEDLQGQVARSPLTLTAAGCGAGYLAVDVWVES